MTSNYPRPRTDNFFSIDVRQIVRSHDLTGSGDNVVWTCPATGNGVRIIDQDPRYIRVEYRRQEGEFKFFLPITKTKCHLGGRRSWFHCPYCLARVAILYIDGPLACRKCWHATYPVQYENAQFRAIGRANKIRARLGASPWLPPYCSPKPKGMHWSTFEALVETLDHFERKAWELRPKWEDEIEERDEEEFAATLAELLKGVDLSDIQGDREI